MITKHTLHSFLIALIVAVAVVYTMVPTPVGGPAPQKAAHQSAFDRIMDSRTIRCGYYVFPPTTYRDPNTGKLSGFSIDMMDRLAERASLKIEWTEEVTFGNWVPAIQAKRFDVVCTPMWPDLPQAKVALFTHSLFYAGKYPAVMASNKRFSDAMTLADLNNETFTFLAQEGNITLNTTKHAVPKAKLYVLPTSADTGEYYQALAAKKADAVITDINSIWQWNSNNPKQPLKLLDQQHPVTLQQYPLVVARGETDLLEFLNLAIDEMNNAGEIDHMLRKWEPEPGKTYLRVKAPLQE